MADAPKKELSLFDSTCIIAGIIIGAAIYRMAPDIAKGVFNWWGVILIWIVGGLLSLCGALCYAELATAYPKEGGDYVYLTRSYGKWAGFLFWWIQLAIVRPGDIAAMAFAFALYARVIFNAYFQQSQLGEHGERYFAAAAVIVLTGLNVAGVKEGKWTQNLLTVVKALGLIAIVAVALIAPSKVAAPAVEIGSFPLSLALVLVLFAYGGWNEMAYVAAEVKNPNRNILRALLLGTVTVIVLYVLVNAAFLYTLGYKGLATSQAVASDSISTVFPNIGGRLISALVCISALGAANGLIFTGARINYAVGSDYSILKFFGRWNPKTGTPVWSLAIQGIIALSFILLLGNFVEIVLYTAFPVYLFFFGTSLAVIVLRFREPNVERPYRVTGYPVTPIIFSAVCLFLIYSTITFAMSQRRLSLVVLVCTLIAGLLIYGFVRQSRNPSAELTNSK